MSSSPLNPTISEFPSDGRIWRVDFLGGLLRNPDNPYEPTIQVSISPLRDALQDDPEELARTNAVIDEDRTTIHIGVGQLPYLKVGSLWADGRCLPYGAGKERTFTGLQIRNHFIIHYEMISNAIRQGSAAAKPPERAENHAFRRSDSSYIALWRFMK